MGATDTSTHTSIASARTSRPPVRLVHLGLGAFHRAHQAWCTEVANRVALTGTPTSTGTPASTGTWGIAAFTGRSPAAAQALSAQDGVFTLLVRDADADHPELVQSVVEAHDGADAEAWAAAVSSRDVAVVTLTITEAGYRRGAGGDLDRADEGVRSDTAALRAGAPGTALVTAPGRLVAGLRARRAAGAGPVAVVSCDNLPANGDVTARVVTALARDVDADLADWIGGHVSFVSTMVDRITPATTEADRTSAQRLTGLADAAPVVTEPFLEWLLCGDFPAGRPQWEAAGARVVDDLAPHERRKLWLLNGGHSLLAYLGQVAGLQTVAAAFADPACRAALEALWDEACEVLPFADAELEVAREALRRRWENPRIEHRLAQIGADGSLKLPVRVVAVAAERHAHGLPVGAAGARAVAAWVRCLRDLGAARTDPAATDLARELAPLAPEGQVAAALDLIAPDLAGRGAFAAAVLDALDAVADAGPTGVVVGDPTGPRSHHVHAREDGVGPSR